MALVIRIGFPPASASNPDPIPPNWVRFFELPFRRFTLIGLHVWKPFAVNPL